MQQISNIKKVIIGVVIVAAVVCVGVFAAMSNSISVPKGQRVMVTVTADQLNDIYGYQLQMNYDENMLEYTGEITSEIEEISMIFAKPFDGYQLVGATMIGDVPGYSGENSKVMTMAFTTKKEMKLNKLKKNISIEGINVINSALDEDNPEGWKMDVFVEDSASEE